MRKLIWILLAVTALAGCQGQQEGVGEVIVLVQEPEADAIKLPTGLIDAEFYANEFPNSDFILLRQAGLANKAGMVIVPSDEYNAVEVRSPFIIGARNNGMDFLNMSGRKLNAAEVSGLSYFYEGKAFAMVEDKFYWLYENGDLERVLFETEPVFLENYGAVSYIGNDYALSKNGYIAYIDAEGFKLMTFGGETSPALDVPRTNTIGMHNGLIYFEFGAIDTAGNVVIPFEYDELIPAGDVGFVARKGNKFGIISGTGEIMLPCEFMGFKEIKDGLVVFETSDVKKNGVMNLKGEIVLYPEYEVIYLGEGRIVGRKDFNNRFVYGVNGVQIPFGTFAPDGGFSDGLVAVMNDNMQRGFAGIDGNAVILCEYDEVGTFRDGYAKVKKENKWGIVDTKGNIVVECKYDKIYGRAGFGFLLEMGNEWYYYK